MNYKLNKEQLRIVMNIDSYAAIMDDANIYNIAKASLMSGDNKALSMEQALQVVSVLSDKQEEFMRGAN